MAKPVPQGAPSSGDAVPLRVVPRVEPSEPVFACVAADEPLRDLARRADASIDLLYCGGIIHRLHRQDGAKLVAECLRVVTPLGCLRIATIDLDAIIHGYLFDWTDDAPAGESRTQRLDAAMRQPGVAFLYGEEELTALLAHAGFAAIIRFGAGASSEPKFWNLESDRSRVLALEARKP